MLTESVCLRRKKLFNTTASATGAAVGAMPGAEALQHLQGGNANGAAGPINIASADPRRPSNVSAASMPGLESVGGMFGSVDGQVPPLLCKSSALVCVCCSLKSLTHSLAHLPVGV